MLENSPRTRATDTGKVTIDALGATIQRALVTGLDIRTSGLVGTAGRTFSVSHCPLLSTRCHAWDCLFRGLKRWKVPMTYRYRFAGGSDTLPSLKTYSWIMRHQPLRHKLGGTYSSLVLFVGWNGDTASCETKWESPGVRRLNKKLSGCVLQLPRYQMKRLRSESSAS